ncbi:MAG: LptF/LptG family permease [Bacteroidales bacterium]|nr:LptF/LptG family permease [Bacteroidales bacterium]
MNLKPKILDRYIMKRFMATFFIALLLIIGIVIIFDISEKIDDFVKNEVPLKSIIFDYYVNFVPYFINMFSPLFVFITVIFFTSRLAANSEIIAMLSGGESYHRIMVPYMASAILIALLSLVLNFYIIPKANVTRVEFEQSYIGNSMGKGVFNRRNVHYQIAPGQFVFVESFSTWNNTAYKMTLESMEENRLVSKLSAESAAWDSTSGSWHMRKYMIRDYNEGLQDRVRCGEQLDTVIALTVTDFYRNENTIEALTIDQLNELIETQKMRGDANVMYAQIEKQRRMTLPFSAIILTIMGVALTSRKKRGVTGWNIALGIGLAFMYILFLRFSEMFVYTGVMSAAAALWLPNVVYTLIAAILYKIAPK